MSIDKVLIFHFVQYIPTNFHSDDIYVSELDRNDELEENEYYYSDLIGLEVVNQNNEKRGVVLEIRELPQADYLVVNYNGKKVLVPFIPEFVVDVNDKIIVNEIEGLFWKSKY